MQLRKRRRWKKHDSATESSHRKKNIFLVYNATIYHLLAVVLIYSVFLHVWENTLHFYQHQSNSIEIWNEKINSLKTLLYKSLFLLCSPWVMFCFSHSRENDFFMKKITIFISHNQSAFFIQFVHCKVFTTKMEIIQMQCNLLIMYE